MVSCMKQMGAVEGMHSLFELEGMLAQLIFSFSEVRYG